MLINWYPGHMHKAQKEVRKIMPSVDIVIEVCDARLPFSSANPMLEQIRANKPSLKVLTKSDLADPKATKLWLDALCQGDSSDALAITKDNPSIARTIPDRARKLLKGRANQFKAIKALILGIPNVGKSTLINTLAGKKIASVGNEPAVTKAQQKIKIADDFLLIDSPGMTWPGSKSEIVNYRLATSGAIRDTAMSYDDVGIFAAEFMAERYPEQLMKAYQLPSLKEEGWQILEQIAKKRGCMQRGGADFQRVGELLVRELRAGKLGRITLEQPGADCDHLKTN
ncbi:ribosome biogenesis GTPase YlqF [Agaribacterium sp. ZY112]|uniref:ribosome biogenesis GTPase YlqF n=1 Tax=Agaribacterium sp. ZY112 TaxID=3233574 RepID=UPI0035261217